MKLLSVINSYCEKFEKFVISWSIILMALIAIVNVLSRNILNSSLTWAEEVTQFTIIWVTFIGTSYAARIGVHIRMSALSDILGHKTKKYLMILVTAGTAALMFYMAYFGYLYTLKLYTTHRLTLGLHIPLYLVILWVPVGFVMTAIQYILTVLKNFREEEVYISPTCYEGQHELEGEPAPSFDF